MRLIGYENIISKSSLRCVRGKKLDNRNTIKGKKKKKKIGDEPNNFNRRCLSLRRCSNRATYEAVSTRQRINPTPSPNKSLNKYNTNLQSLRGQRREIWECVAGANIRRGNSAELQFVLLGYGRSSRLRPSWVDSCQLRKTNQSPLLLLLLPPASQTLLHYNERPLPSVRPCSPTSRLPLKRAAPPCFVFGEEKPKTIPTPNRAAIMFCRNVTRHSS